MSYKYEVERSKLFTDEELRRWIPYRDAVHALLKQAGAIRMGEAMSLIRGGGDSWTMLAYMDRLVELGEVQEIDYGNCAGQHRIFVSRKGG